MSMMERSFVWNEAFLEGTKPFAICLQDLSDNNRYHVKD